MGLCGVSVVCVCVVGEFVWVCVFVVGVCFCVCGGCVWFVCLCVRWWCV